MIGRRRKIRISSDLTVTAAALLLTVLLGLPACAVVAEQTAVAAVAAVMPQGGALYLRQRFTSEAAVENAEPQLTPPPPSEPETTDEKEPVTAEREEDPIPEEYRGRLLHETFTAEDDGTWMNLGTGWLRNYTDLGFEDIQTALDETPLLQLEPTDRPQVLILHTHATESYETHNGEYYDTRTSWRSQNEEENMCAIGEIFARELEQNGIGVVHDTTQHDYPGYNGSYDRSRSTAEAVLAKHPTIRVILDIHRDAIQRDEATIVAPITEIDGRQCAQVMIAVGCDDGLMDMPEWRQNLRFGAELQNRLEADWPTLTRPLFFAYRKYNQDMAPGALLIEVGASGNTLEQAAYAAELTAQTLGRLLKEMEKPS